MEFNTTRQRPSPKIRQTTDLTIETLHLHGINHMCVHVGCLIYQHDIFQRIGQNAEFNLDSDGGYFNFGGFDITTA